MRTRRACRCNSEAPASDSTLTLTAIALAIAAITAATAASARDDSGAAPQPHGRAPHSAARTMPGGLLGSRALPARSLHV